LIFFHQIQKDKIIILLIVPLILFAGLLPFMPLMEPDESRYSDIPAMMNRTGDYVTPKLHHAVYLEKPPLAYWATAFFFKLFGENEFSSRLFGGLSAWGCVILAFFMGRRLRDEKTGLYAAAILSTFLFHFVLARINILDMPLTLFVSLAIWACYLFLESGARKWLYLAYFACALAFLTKGLIGLVFPFAISGLLLAWQRRWRDIPRLLSPVGLIIFFAVSLPWLIMVQKANPDFFRFFFIQEHFLRYTTKMHGRDNTVFYFLPVVIFGTLPWSAFIWRAKEKADVRWRDLYSRSGMGILLIWILFVFLFYSVSSSKLVPYAGPIFIPAAVLFARVFCEAGEEKTAVPGAQASRLSRIPIIAQAVLFIAVLLAPLVLRNVEFGRDLVIMQSDYWPVLIAAPVLFQIMLVFVPDRAAKRWKRGWFAAIYSISVLFMGSLVFPISDFLTPYKSAKPLAQAIQQFVPADQMVYQYKIALYGVDFYNGIRTPIVEDFGELGFGIEKLPPEERRRFFLSAPDFYRLCREKREIYCATQYEHRLAELKKEIPECRVLWDNNAFFLIKIENKG